MSNLVENEEKREMKVKEKMQLLQVFNMLPDYLADIPDSDPHTNCILGFLDTFSHPGPQHIMHPVAQKHTRNPHFLYWQDGNSRTVSPTILQ